MKLPGASRLRRVLAWVRRHRTLVALVASGSLAAGVWHAVRNVQSDVVAVAPTFGTPALGAASEMPMLARRSFQTARDLAWARDLVLTEAQVPAARERRGKILDQFPLPGMTVRPGDAVTVTVSLGESDVPLPDDPRGHAQVPLRLTVIPVDILTSRLARATARAAARATADPPGATPAR